MSTRSPTRTDSHDPPRRHRRWPLLTSLGLLLLATLAAAAAALHSVGGRDDTTSFTAAGAHELVIGVHAGRIDLVPSPDGRIHVTTTRRWSLWAPTARHTEAGGVLPLTGDCPLPGSLGITRCAVDQRVTVPAGTSLRVTANTGNLTATDLAVASFEAQASRGSISASFVRPPHQTLVRLDAGSVRLTVPATTYAVDATVPATPATSPSRSPPTPPPPDTSQPTSPAATSRSFAEGASTSSFLDEGDLLATPSPRGSRIVEACNHLPERLPSRSPR